MITFFKQRRRQRQIDREFCEHYREPLPKNNDVLLACAIVAFIVILGFLEIFVIVGGRHA